VELVSQSYTKLQKVNQTMSTAWHMDQWARQKALGEKKVSEGLPQGPHHVKKLNQDY
jgi:hypothetical protein